MGRVRNVCHRFCWKRGNRLGYALAFLLLLSSSTFSGYVQAQKAEGSLSDLSFTGRYQLKLQDVVVNGDALQYVIENGYTPGARWKQDLSLSAFGPLYGGWQLQGKFDSSLLPTQRLDVTVRRTGDELHLGTRRFQTGDAGLLDWARQITGVQGTVALGADENFRLSGVFGQPVGTPAHEVLPGRGITGPYLLNELHLPVVPESEEVRVDDIIQTRGTDYKIDYDSGSLVFREPVLETSTIVIDFEYESEKKRQTGLAMARWQSGAFTFDALAGAEYALEEEDPLVFIPPTQDGAVPEPELPQQQTMQGLGVTWRPYPGANLVASWLNTANENDEEQVQAPAWQIGGGWQDAQGRAGFDYRHVSPGFRMMGRTASEDNYERLTAGYERQLTGPWYSKFNVLMRSPLQTDQAATPAREKAEHVLTYATDSGFIGWLVGFDGWQAVTGPRQLYTSGLLLGKRAGPWDLRLERRGVIARRGEFRLGETLSQTKVSANLVDSPTWNAALAWKEERQASAGDVPGTISDVRITTGSKQSGESKAPYNWQALWRQSEILRPGSDTQGVPYRPLRTTFTRLEGDTEVGLENLRGSLSLEERAHSGQGALQVTQTGRAGLEYTPPAGLSWETFLIAQKDSIAGESSVGSGGSVQVPFGQGWRYSAGLHRFSEISAGEARANSQVTHGVSWSNSAWVLSGDWVAGLLEEPDLTGESGDESVSLDQVPMGRRLELTAQRKLERGSVSTSLERDWQADADTWRVGGQATWELESFSLEGRVMRSDYRSDEGLDIEQNSSLGVRWRPSDSTSFSLQGQWDLSRSSTGLGEYSGTGLFATWSQYF